MNISGIRPSVGFYDYNSIRMSSERAAMMQEAKASATGTLQDTNLVSGTEQSESQSREQFKKPDNGNAEFASRYEPNATYELKGADSDIFSLDMEQAISEMQKDQVLQQYQFFVGEQGVSAHTDDMGVREIENFTF